MTSFDRAYAERQFGALADDELREILASRADEYTPEALALVHAELDRRARAPRPDAPVIAVREGEGRPASGARGAKVWIDVYAALMICWAVVGVTAALLGGGGSGLEALFILHLATAYGLLKRRAWAWYLNIPLMCLNVIMPPVAYSAFMVFGRFAWFIGNVIYFAKVRRSFAGGSS